MENVDKNKKEFLKIKPPSKTAVEKAALEHAVENPDIQKLLKKGKNVYIDNEGHVNILEDDK